MVVDAVDDIVCPLTCTQADETMDFVTAALKSRG